MLRPFRLEDVDDLAATSGPEDDPEFTGSAIFDAQAASAFVERVLQGVSMEGLEVWSFAIQFGEDPRLIGMIQLTIRRSQNAGGLSYGMNPAFRRRGLMAEAIGKVIAFGFLDRRLERISAQGDARNIGSWRAMEKAGMRREALLRHHRKYGDRYYDSVTYAMIRPDFEAANHGPLS